MKKAGLMIGILLMFVSGIAFIVCALLAAELAEGIEEEIFTGAQLGKGIVVSAVVFLLALVLTSLSAIFVGMDFARKLRAQEKWKKRL